MQKKIALEAGNEIRTMNQYIDACAQGQFERRKDCTIDCERRRPDWKERKKTQKQKKTLLNDPVVVN